MTGRTKHPGTKKDRPRGVVARSPGVKRSAKIEGSVACRTCGVVQHKGSWSWGPVSEGPVTKVLCPACTRIRERYAAGTVIVPPAFLEKRSELERMVRNLEEAESAEHPLERVMDIVERNGALVVTTTGVHLARLVAHRIAKRFHQKPRFRYADDEDLVHVEWEAPKPSPRKAVVRKKARR